MTHALFIGPALGYWHGHPHGGFPFFIIPLLFWLTLVVFLVTGRRRWRGGFGTRGGEQVLAENFARGEITEEQFRERLAVLREARRNRR